MKRAIFIGIMTLYNFLIALMCSDLAGITTIGDDLIIIPDEVRENIFTLIGDALDTFSQLITFNVEGIPASLIIVFIYIPNIVVFVVLLTLIFNRN